MVWELVEVQFDCKKVEAELHERFADERIEGQ